MEAVIIKIDNAEAPVLNRHFQCIQQVPTGATEVIRESVQHQAVAHPVKLIVPTANALIIPYQQLLMLIHHSQTEKPVHCDYEFR